MPGYSDKIKRIYEFMAILRKEKLYRLFLFLVIAVLLFGFFIYKIENNNPAALIKNFEDGIWWGFVTIFTVGYGDKVPVTLLGRAIGIIMMFSGLVFTVLISGTIASVLVERKMKEGKGLRMIDFKDHIVICGWNSGGDAILEGLMKISSKTKDVMRVVLVNELEIDTLNELQFTYTSKNLIIEFIRGNFAHPQVLEKAKINNAKSVLMLSDSVGAPGGQTSDEKTIFGAFAVINNFPGVKLSVELVNPQNEQYLKNAGIDNIIITGQFNSFLLMNSAVSPGIPKAAREMMSLDMKHGMMSSGIPSVFVGKKFDELFDFYRKSESKMLIGIISESRKLSIDDFLSDDPSAIDDFIKRKFAESEKDYFADTAGSSNVLLNPGWDYVIKRDDKALVIGNEL